MDDSAITCDEIIESYDEETKTVPYKYYPQFFLDECLYE